MFNGIHAFVTGIFMTGCLLLRPKASNICVVLHWCPLVFFALPQVPSFSASKERSKNYFYTFEEENPLKRVQHEGFLFPSFLLKSPRQSGEYDTSSHVWHVAVQIRGGHWNGH